MKLLTLLIMTPVLALGLALTSGIAEESPASGPADAPKHPQKPMLWKIEGKSLVKPSWLFGTIHVSKGPVGTLHPTALKALESSDAVYTELPGELDIQLGLTAHFLRQDGKTLTGSIGPDLTAKLDTELKAVSPVLTAEGLDLLKTWTMAIFLPTLQHQLEEGGQGAVALDSIVWKKAEEAGLRTDSLETAEGQLKVLDELTEKEQVELLAETIRSLEDARADDEDPIADLVAAYVAGDEDAIGAAAGLGFAEIVESEDSELAAKLRKAMIDERNASMAGTISEHLVTEPGQSHFFAVGVGHYIGKGNIGERLAHEGYSVTRVTE